MSSKSKVLDLASITNFKIPEWAGKPPAGLHLDVLKDGKLIQKLMIDEKNCYLFGRNRQFCDFIIEHQSCSRVHGALVWHKDLHRPFLIDCGSVHGTFVGSIRLESGKPQQIPIDSKIHFGASTRVYVIRERISSAINGLSQAEDLEFVSNLPEDESELDNLTEFNTAQNKRNTSVSGSTSSSNTNVIKTGRKSDLYVHFSDQEEVINPEDIDPSIGRFRNLVQETFIPTKRQCLSESGDSYPMSIVIPSNLNTNNDVTHDSPVKSPTNITPGSTTNIAHINPAFSAASKLGLPMPNLAAEPTITSLYSDLPSIKSKTTIKLSTGQKLLTIDSSNTSHDNEDGPRKKKYAKEAWPGKKPIGAV